MINPLSPIYSDWFPIYSPVRSSNRSYVLLTLCRCVLVYLWLVSYASQFKRQALQILRGFALTFLNQLFIFHLKNQKEYLDSFQEIMRGENKKNIQVTEFWNQKIPKIGTFFAYVSKHLTYFGPIFLPTFWEGAEGVCESRVGQGLGC